MTIFVKEISVRGRSIDLDQIDSCDRNPYGAGFVLKMKSGWKVEIDDPEGKVRQLIADFKKLPKVEERPGPTVRLDAIERELATCRNSVNEAHAVLGRDRNRVADWEDRMKAVEQRLAMLLDHLVAAVGKLR